MSVLFHIATARDWERAANTGTYATESLRREGITRAKTSPISSPTRQPQPGHSNHLRNTA